MASIRQFTTQAKQTSERVISNEEVTYTIDGRDVTFLPPTSGQIAIAISSMSDLTENQGVEGAGAIINFFFSLLNAEDHLHFKRRLFNRDDPFELDQISEIVEALFEEWSAHPSQPQPDSLGLPHSTGPRSTVRHHKAG